MELKDLNEDSKPCCCPSPVQEVGDEPQGFIMPMASEPADSGCCDSSADEPCCGPPPPPPSSPHERPGHILCGFVEDFIDTPMGPVPLVSTCLNREDRLGTLKTRLNIGRTNYKVSPGIYGVGRPDQESPVIVTCNYKLTFDILRTNLAGIDCWILVLDTRGINVWCAAGKGTLSTSEVVSRVRNTGLEKLVSHRKLILPQLGATGIAGHRLKKECGFEPVWGPVRAEDLKKFLAKGMKANEQMRRVTFTIAERTVLVPVEISLVLKPSLWVLLAAFLLSGFGADIFSLTALWQRGAQALLYYIGGILAGAVATPILLPWIPFRSFYLKGIMAGLIMSLFILVMQNSFTTDLMESSALVLFCLAVSSFTAMNFTGATPYTSPTGVEKEMRQGIPLQILATLTALVLWVWAGFTA